MEPSWDELFARRPRLPNRLIAASAVRKSYPSEPIDVLSVIWALLGTIARDGSLSVPIPRELDPDKPES